MSQKQKESARLKALEFEYNKMIEHQRELEDYNLGKKLGLPIFCPVDGKAEYTKQNL